MINFLHDLYEIKFHNFYLLFLCKLIFLQILFTIFIYYFTFPIFIHKFLPYFFIICIHLMYDLSRGATDIKS